MIGYIGTDSIDGTIRFIGSNNINTTFKMSGYKKNWLVVGSAIGKIVSSDFTINVGDDEDASSIVTDSHKMIANYDSDKIGENADGGGLIGYIAAKGTYTDREINIYNLVFDGAQVANYATKRGGGLLGYAWLDTNTTIKGLKVTSAAIVNSTAPDVGVMCYDASGKWTIDSLTVNGLTMSTGAADSIGMIVNKAYNDSTKDNTNGLYIDLLNSGYKLTESGINLSTTAKFDEIAAYTASNEDNVVKGGGDTGIISVNMNSDRDGSKTKISETGTYQNRLSSVGSTKYPNSTARYYYNLNIMNVSDPTEKAILWSVRQYAAGNLKGIISVNEITEPFSYEKAEAEQGEESAEEQTNTKINFTGYAYYPVYNVSNVALKNVDITFDYVSIPTATETVFNAPSVTDDYVRDPKNNGAGVNSRNQHFLMQSGLFINNAEKSTLSLDNVNLSGNFLEVGDYKGVLISGTSYGSIDIDGLVLDGIKPMGNAADINANGYLLVNNVKRNSTASGAIGINLCNISTSNKYTSGDVTEQITKSLFGAVNGPAIGIDVQKVKLDARKAGTLSNNALKKAYGTVNSIFTEATLFASIRTTQASQMIYNYTVGEDWGEGGSGGKRWVTYGKEVKDSKEYVDENGKSRENKYYESSVFTDPEEYSPDSEYNFNRGWLPYVGHEYNKTEVDNNGCYWRELKVNVGASDLGQGCGTYNDPYAITKGEKLAAFANFMYYGNDTNARALGQFRLPKDSEKYDSIEENTSGVRWCSDDDAIYSWDGSKSKFTSSEEGAKEWSSDNARQYLENAYFQIQNDITLDSFIGFGHDNSHDTTGVYAFRGVIVGSKNDGSLVTITNKSSSPLINISNGCVVKDLNIIQANNIALTQGDNAYNTSTNAFGYNSGCTYYGGIIGEVMGGDNIIDNTYITFAYKEKVESTDEETGAVTTTDVDRNSTVSLGNTNTSLLIPVGSYIGVVVFGGVIFKNMDADTVNDNAKTLLVNSGNYTNLAKADKKGAIYANPLIGRVINGYAVNETVTDESNDTTGRFSVTEDGTYHDGKNRTGLPHSLNNTNKHYPIADINADLNSDDKNKLDVTKIPTGTDEEKDGEINVPNAQALFILSLITQSASGTATEGGGDYVNSLSYGTYGSNVYGMSHIADYDNVGIGTNADSTRVADYNDLAKLDTAEKTAVPYIIRYYTTKKEARTIQVPKYKYSMSSEYTVESSKYTGSNTSLDNGTGFIIYNSPSYYLSDTVLNENPKKIASTTRDEAKVWFFEKASNREIDNNRYYIYTLNSDDQIEYMVMTWKDGNDGNLFITTDKTQASIFTVTENNGNFKIFEAKAQKYFRIVNGKFTGYKESHNMNLLETTATFNIEDDGYENVSVPGGYLARNVVSTLGYYDIKLTGSSDYQLPDSFRGLGSIGYYDNVTTVDTNNMKQDDDVGGRGGDIYYLNSSKVYIYAANRLNNRYTMKVDQFDGNDQVIDVDIYLNKYKNDNYFNKLHENSTATQTTGSGLADTSVNTNRYMHGIGLFDSVITADENSIIKDFDLSGSVKTEIYDNSFSNSSVNGAAKNGTYNWISVGGVCGWATNANWVGFSKIALKDLTVYGQVYVGGLLGSSGTCSKVRYVVIQECSATNLSITANCGSGEDKRGGVGSFVGKAKEGGVIIYGTPDKDGNKNASKKSIVEIAGFSVYNNSQMITGGLVGYAGNGVQAYDMLLKPKEGETIVIGGTEVYMSGGIVGLMQPCEAGLDSCQAVFKNCKLENISVQARNYAGGFYGGTHTDSWVPYKITIDSCSVEADEKDTCSIEVTNGGYVGGFVGYGSVYKGGNDENPNIVINDSIVKNYDILATNNGGYVGGFIGYLNSRESNSAVVCSVTNSSVEYCELGNNASANTYVGGAVGYLNKNTVNDKVAGYNVKLDHVEMLPTSSSRLGAWIGCTDGTNPTIKFHGVGIYGKGFSKNVGNQSTYPNASFVYADYNNKNSTMNDSNKNKATYNDGSDVDMPKYPYVNVNPQSGMGANSGTLAEGEKADKVISSDGAVLYSQSEAVVPGSLIYAKANEPVSADADLDGRTFIISNTRSGNSDTSHPQNTPWYLAIGKGATKTTENQTLEQTEATPFLFTKNPSASKQYSLSYVNKNGETKYLNINNGDDKNFESDTPVYYELNVSSSRYYLKKIGVNGASISPCIVDHNNGSGWSLWSNSYSGGGHSLDLLEYYGSGGKPDIAYSYEDTNGETKYYTAAKTMAAKIYADIVMQETTGANYTRRYTTYPDTPIKEGGNTIEHYLQRTRDEDTDRISTYATEKGISPNRWEDFACVVIANTDNDETTGLINHYIQLVTNTTDDYNTDSATYFNVDIRQCELVDGHFKQTNNEPGIKLEVENPDDPNSTNMQFKLDQDNADSQNKNTFTLIDVQFYDPLSVSSDEKKVAYHLYVPVFTYKQMTYEFHAGVMTGTNSVSYDTDGNTKKNGYEELFTKNNKLHLDTFDAWVTTYLRYTYSGGDLTALINSGNLDWNHAKSAKINLQRDDYDRRLPDSTYMILVDLNGDSDKAYYANIQNMTKSNDTYKADITLELNKFSRNGKPFSEQTFNDLIAKDFNDPVYNQGKGYYNMVKGIPTENDGKTYVYVINAAGKKTYYEYISTGTGNYDLTLPDDYVLNEDYYIATYAPQDESETNFYIYDYKIDDPGTLEAPQAGAKSAAVSDSNDYEVIIGDLFNQKTEKLTVNPEEQQITASNKEINIYTTTSFWLSDPRIGGKIEFTDQGIYHGLNINLDRYDEVGNITNNIEGLEDDENTTRLQAWYSTSAEITGTGTGTSAKLAALNEEKTMVLIQTAGDIKSSLIGTTEAAPFTIYSRVFMNFDENKLEAEFPEQKGSAGVNVRVASQLAYETDRLATSSMTAEYAKDRHIYHRESMNSAKLIYNAKDELDEYDKTGKMSENHTRIGVNGKTSDLQIMPINTAADYNTQILNIPKDRANYLYLRFALNKKTDTEIETETVVDGETKTVKNITKVEYVPVNISDYINGAITFKSGDIEKTVNVSEAQVNQDGKGTYIEVIIPKSEMITVTDDMGNSSQKNGSWDEKDDIYHIDISFNVITGESFIDYANYRIDLQAIVMDTQEHKLDDTIASDHLVYTNAKVNHEFLKVS